MTLMWRRSLGHFLLNLQFGLCGGQMGWGGGLYGCGNCHCGLGSLGKRNSDSCVKRNVGNTQRGTLNVGKDFGL